MSAKKLCLVMIVKNEEHIILETLKSIRKYIDYYVICDTGSTDRTKEIIKQYFDSENIQGEIYDHEWVDFSHNRTLAFEKSRNKANYCIVFDADDLIEGELIFPQKMNKSCYQLKLSDESKSHVYKRRVIFKNDTYHNWKYVGVLHEVPICSESVKCTEAVIEGDYFLISRRKGARSQNKLKYLNDAKVLKKYVKEHPNNRDMFYIANSYKDHAQVIKDINYLNKAIYWYEKRILNDGLNGVYYGEEVMLSLKNIAYIYKIFYEKGYKSDVINLDYIIKKYKDAYDYDNDYMEPVYQICWLYYNDKNYKEADKWLNKSIGKKLPERYNLFINKWDYDIGIYFIGCKIKLALEDYKKAFEYGCIYRENTLDRLKGEKNQEYKTYKETFRKIKKKYQKSIKDNKPKCFFKVENNFNEMFFDNIIYFLKNYYEIIIVSDVTNYNFGLKKISKIEFNSLINSLKNEELMIFNFDHIDNFDDSKIIKSDKHKKVCFLINEFKIYFGIIKSSINNNKILQQLCKSYDLIYVKDERISKLDNNIIFYPENKYNIFFEKKKYLFNKEFETNNINLGLEFEIPFFEEKKDEGLKNCEKIYDNSLDIKNNYSKKINNKKTNKKSNNLVPKENINKIQNITDKENFFILNKEKINRPEFYFEYIKTKLEDLKSFQTIYNKILMFPKNSKTKEMLLCMKFLTVKLNELKGLYKESLLELKKIFIEYQQEESKFNILKKMIFDETIENIILDCYKNNIEYFINPISIKTDKESKITIIINSNNEDNLLKTLFSFINSLNYISDIPNNNVSFYEYLVINKNNNITDEFYKKYNLKKYDSIKTKYAVYLDENFIFTTFFNFIKLSLELFNNKGVIFVKFNNIKTLNSNWEPCIINFKKMSYICSNPFNFDFDEFCKILSCKKYLSNRLFFDNYFDKNELLPKKFNKDENIKNYNFTPRILNNCFCEIDKLNKFTLDNISFLKECKTIFYNMEELNIDSKIILKNFFNNEYNYDRKTIKKIFLIFKILENKDLIKNYDYIMFSCHNSTFKINNFNKLVEKLAFVSNEEDIVTKNKKLGLEYYDLIDLENSFDGDKFKPELDCFIISKKAGRKFFKYWKEKSLELNLGNLFNQNNFTILSENICTKIERPLHKKLEGFVFLSEMDCYGYDLEDLSNKNLNDVEKEARENKKCVAFNTNGYLKYKIPSIYNLDILYKSDKSNPGIYIKEDVYKKLVNEYQLVRQLEKIKL